MVVSTNRRLGRDLNISEFHVVVSGIAELDSEWACDKTKDPYSRIYITVSGEGEVMSEGKVYMLKPGEIMFIPAGATFGYKCERSMKQIYFHLNFFGVDRLDIFKDYSKIHVFDTIAERYRVTEQLFSENSLGSEAVFSAIISEVCALVLADSDIKRESSGDYSTVVLDIMNKVQSEHNIQLSLSDFAHISHMSKSTLSRLFKKEMGMGFNEYVDTVVFTKAASELLCTDMTVREISANFGFCDEFYFSRRFKARFGKSPSEYRKSGIGFWEGSRHVKQFVF